MSTPEIDIDACAATFVARMQARMDAARERADRLREQAASAARVLASEFGVTKTWLFGSLAWGDPHPSSDVDLLVEGLEPRDACRAEHRLATIIDGPFDLVLVQEAPSSLVTRVREDGILLS